MKHWLKKWTRWEFLPWWLANVPVYFFYLWFAARARHLFFFSNVNPAIPLGGAMGESKWDILQLLPKSLVPTTVLIPSGSQLEDILGKMDSGGLKFPVIAKPNIGERGFLIEKLENEVALSRYIQRVKVPFLLQKMLNEPMEATVLFHRFPDGAFGITSVCVKDFLGVQGNGVDAIGSLLQENMRGALQYERLSRLNPDLLARIPAAGERVLIEPIGNHSRGTKFLNGNHLIDDALHAAFEPICARISGVCYGRFDLKTESVDALRSGRFQVMELNGVLGEPAHIYDPEFGAFRAYRDLYRHWRILYRLHRAQIRAGIPAPSHRESFREVSAYFKYKREAEAAQGN
ncbi:MAG: D-alanine--D-alanine ligase [Saprospiraceae bacterium]